MMKTSQLIGCNVNIVGANPDLFDSHAVALIRAIDLDSQSLLLEFSPKIQVGEQYYEFAVASARLERDDLSVLLIYGVLGCAITCIPSDHYNALKPFNLTWWRGGGAAIGDIVLDNTQLPRLKIEQ